MKWRQETYNDGVDALHALSVPESEERIVRWCSPERSALVLGSAQRDDVVDYDSADRKNIDIVRRRSGGGAVLVEPGDIVWCDIFIPVSDPLWVSDVGTAFHWLGDVWVEALSTLTKLPLTVHKGGMQESKWSRLVCFAGMGPGEVSLNGRKLVGISQRRTRSGALFQCALFRRFRVERLVSLLELSAEDRADLSEYLGTTTVRSADIDENALVKALMTALENA